MTAGRTAISRREVATEALWLLDLDIGGRVYRISTQDAEVDGERYPEGLADLQIRIDEEAPSATIVVDGVEEWARLVARGAVLAAARATLRRWHRGQALASARVLVAGAVADPSYEPDRLEFTLEDLVDAPSARTLPDSGAVIAPWTWPLEIGAAFDSGLLGTAYPVIFGQPGWTARPTETSGNAQLRVYASPAYCVQSGGLWQDAAFSPSAAGQVSYTESLILIAGHEVMADEVILYDASVPRTMRRDEDPSALPEADERLPVHHVADRQGRIVACVKAGDSARMLFAPDHEYWVTWPSGGGIPNRERTGALRGMGEIIEWLLDYAGEQVDRGRMAIAREVLDRYRLDFALVEPIDDLPGWIMQTMGEVCPLVRRRGARGTWYEARRYHADPEDVVMRLVDAEEGRSDGVPIRIEGSIDYGPLSDVANEITVHYKPRTAGNFQGRVTVTGDEATVDVGARRYAARYAIVSRSRYGLRTTEIDAPLVHDDDTALLIGQEAAVRMGVQRRQVVVSGGLELEALDLGDAVELASDRWHLAGEIGLVRALDIAAAGVSVEVELLDRVDLRRRAT